MINGMMNLKFNMRHCVTAQRNRTVSFIHSRKNVLFRRKRSLLRTQR